MTSDKPVWLVIGCSSGFGHEIASQALARGYSVIATSRSSSKLVELKSQGAEVIDLDVRSPDEAVQASIDAAVAKFGRLDVLVNNAGYVLIGSVEECSHEEVLAQYDTNVFGLLKVLRATLPHMRKQRSGVVANIGSIGGWRGSPVAGLYCSTKFAVAGITEALRGENESFGIECLVIEPGYFRTDFLAEGHKVVASNEIDELRPLSSSMKETFAKVNHNQPGDPKKGAAVIVDALSKTGPWAGKPLPLRLVLGSDAQGYVDAVMERSRRELDEWRPHVSQTDHDDVVSAS